LPAQARRLETELRTEYPDRDFQVIAGDCNETLGLVLQDLQRGGGWDWAPTFALVDQYAAEVRWTTLEQLSRFKNPKATKAELWLLFAASMLPRGPASENADAVERFTERITEMYGTDAWRAAYIARRRKLLSGGQLRDELLNLMRWRLERVLGYRMTHSFDMRNSTGNEIYNLVFATDHDAGERIMDHIYRRAAEAQPAMVAEAAARRQHQREERAGVPGLFPPPVRPDVYVPHYRHEPPWPPYELPADDGLADDQ
jgi:three-Cys-motif partner protein